MLNQAELVTLLAVVVVLYVDRGSHQNQSLQSGEFLLL